VRFGEAYHRAMPTVDAHLSGRSPHVLQIYRKLVDASTTLGPVEEDPKKTSIHLNRRVAFAGVWLHASYELAQ